MRVIETPISWHGASEIDHLSFWYRFYTRCLSMSLIKECVANLCENNDHSIPVVISISVADRKRTWHNSSRSHCYRAFRKSTWPQNHCVDLKITHMRTIVRSMQHDRSEWFCESSQWSGISFMMSWFSWILGFCTHRNKKLVLFELSPSTIIDRLIQPARHTAMISQFINQCAFIQNLFYLYLNMRSIRGSLKIDSNKNCFKRNTYANWSCLQWKRKEKYDRTMPFRHSI